MKTRLITYLVYLLLCFSANVYGQLQQQQPQRRQAYIEKTGVASRAVNPDEITICLVICERIEDKGGTGLDAQEKQMKEGLMNLDIDLSNLTLNISGETYVEEKHFLHKKEIALQQKSFLLKVEDVAIVEKVFHLADELKLKYAEICKVEYSKKDELAKELRVEAVKDAKEQAVGMLEAAGDTTGKTLSVKDHLTKSCRIKKREETKNDPATMDLTNKYFTKITYTVKAHMKFAIK